MEGRKHSGVVVTTATHIDASRARAWEEQLRGEPTAASGDVSPGIGFRIAAGYELDGATHLTLYETQLDDVAAAAARVETESGNKAESYTKIAEYGPASDGPTAGIVLVYTDCDEPAEEEAFNDWYTGHLPHTVENLDFYAATRYVSNDPSRTTSRYLAIYESQSGDPAAVQKAGVEWWVASGLEGPAAMVLRSAVAAERIA
jgi:hypothetical protein